VAVLSRGDDPPQTPPAHGGTARPPVPPWPPASGGSPPPLSFRAFGCWLTVYRRIWRSSIWSSVLGPLVMLALGLVHSPWAVLIVPVAVLIGFAFAALGMTGTTYMKSWQDFDYVILASMPLFLFSATFYPLSVYPRAVRVIVECTPLYQGVVLLRDLTVGVVGPDLLWRAAYLAVLGLAGLYVSGRRLARLLLV
jgi:lipooligosaccharide transport system permease protein